MFSLFLLTKEEFENLMSQFATSNFCSYGGEENQAVQLNGV